MQFSQIDLSPTTNQVKADLVLGSGLQEVTNFMRLLLKLLKSYNFDNTDVFAIQLAVEEALVNAIKHGNEMDRSKRVHVALALGRKDFCIRIRDEGQGFDPSDVSDPTSPENLERSSGRGLLLIRHFMHKVRYNHKGNALLLVRHRASAS